MTNPDRFRAAYLEARLKRARDPMKVITVIRELRFRALAREVNNAEKEG